LKTASVFRDN